MKLFHAATSPYARKVYACAISRGLDSQIELIPTNPHISPPELLAMNPLSKIPCLITGDGLALFDSPVICEYLDSLDGGLPLYPRGLGPRLRVLKQQAIADGIMDAAVLRRMEQGRPQEAARDAVMARAKDAVDRALAVLEADTLHQTVDIGTIAIACALGYLTLRFAAEPWREGHPKLTAWFAEFALNPCIARTKPTP
jgi:glutathione S-transferase